MSITPEDVKGKQETVSELREKIAAQKVARSEINAETERVIESQKLDVEIARLSAVLEDEQAITAAAETNAAKVLGESAPAPVEVDPPVEVVPPVEVEAAVSTPLVPPALRAPKSDSVKSSDSDKGI